MLPASGSLRNVRRSIGLEPPLLSAVGSPFRTWRRSSFRPSRVRRVRPSPDPLPAFDGGPAVVRGGPPRLKTLRFVPAPWLLSPASSPPSNQASFACRQPELSFDHLSARARSVGGMVRPRAFAIFRLITNKNLVGCCTGKS